MQAASQSNAIRMNLSEIQQLLRDKDVEFIRFEQTDTHGISRSKTIPARHFEFFANHGVNFLLGQLGFDVQAFVAPGTGYLEELGFPDSHIRPDLDTFQVLPWADKTARILCEPYYLDGRPALAAPRLIVKKLLSELEAMGTASSADLSTSFISSTPQPFSLHFRGSRSLPRSVTTLIKY